MPSGKWVGTKQMKKSTKLLFTLFWILMLAQTVSAQKITGVVLDDENGDTIAFASAFYKGNHIGVASDASGRFSIERHNGWTLTVSAIGYKQQQIPINANTKADMVIRLKPEAQALEEVVVKSKKSKYSRKDNPAVELMKRVVAAKKRTHLDNHDFYQYNKYQRITLAVNDISPQELLEAQEKKKQWFVDQIELCPINGKLILPISVDETVSQRIYRKSPHAQKDIIHGQSTKGINQLIETGNVLNAVLKDVFTDVDIYDDNIKLLRNSFTSPIGSGAVAFYRFYIVDTVFVGRDRCIHLQFYPNNQQDFGFNGELYVLNDSTLHVKKCDLKLPARTGVNFVEDMKISQEYTQLDNGEWALSADDMSVEMSLAEFLTKAIVIRSTRMSDYSFEELPKSMFKGKANTRYDPNAKLRDNQFWEQHRSVELTNSESSMSDFIHRVENIKGFKYLLFAAKALIENFVETGSEATKSKFDIGPVNTVISNNFVDGIRFRASGQTTAALNPHLFWKGYYAYGTKSHRHYYSSLLTYSFNKKEYQPGEFPIRTISFETARDVMSPSDKFLGTDKDNVFTAFRWSKVNQMYFYNRQQLKFDWETEWGFRTTFNIKAESNEPTGELDFIRLSDGQPVNKIRTSEMTLALDYCPGRSYINTKQHRIAVNLDNPEFTLSHTMGFDGILGGQYRYNYTELGVYTRLWLKTWGKMECHFKAGAQWNKVPFPLLNMPPTNLSYVISKSSFSLMNNMEFLNDRFFSANITWDLKGKIFNRIPLIRKLKWREVVGIKGIIGMLTDKNNPTLARNANDDMLFAFPEGTHFFNHAEPYWELVVGVRNIFRFFQIDYVRRLSYTGLPGIKKHGIRFGFEFSF